MPMSILGLAAGPRAGGNSDILLDECLRGAREAGAQVELVRCRDLHFRGCIACNACFTTGECVLQDDMQGLYDKMIACDRLVFATPIFFMNTPWLGKMAIDRCQCLWARKYILKLPLFDPPRTGRQAAVIAVGATRGKSLFDGLMQTMQHVFQALELDHVADVLVRQVDGKGEIRKRPEVLEQAYELGRKLGAEEGGERPGANHYS